MSSDGCPIPAHVPPHLVRDMDLYNIEGGTKDPFCAMAALKRDAPDIFFTPHYGGYWVLNRPDLIEQAFADPVQFSSDRAVTVPPIPSEAPAMAPIQVDPPLHKFFRQPYNIALSPARLGALTARAREVVIERIDSFVDKGECDFLAEMANHVPVAIVMQIFDLPFSDRHRLTPFADTMIHASDLEERAGAIQGMAGYAAEYVVKRELNPGDDLISKLLQVKIDDRPITREEVIFSVTLLLFGGLDAVSHTMGFIMRFLAENPRHRQQLAENPALIPDAIEELLRRHSISSIARVLPKDVLLDGVQMKAGDRVILELSLHGLDERAWSNPMEVDFGRKPKDIMTFGKGIHRCVGANLARAEIRVLLEEWFKRIPEFNIKPGETPVTMTGQSKGITHLPLVWPVTKHGAGTTS